ncbi:MAG: ferrous iron transport protein B [Candidatus Helarchaeota archaeon]
MNDDDYELILTEERYKKIEELLSETFKPPTERIIWTDVLDRVFLNKWLGIPIFLTIIWAMFQFTFEVPGPLVELIGLLEIVGEFVANAIPNWIGSLLGMGVINGLAFVLVFVPNIFFLFLFLSFLEDSGYLSRAAFVMDRAMVKLGLHGKSFIPMLMGLGCNIPAIMATRSIADENDRKITILINPFISCGARLPVYILIAGFFFPVAIVTPVVYSLYLLGFIVAVLMALLLRKTILKGKPSSFIMELPPYRTPTPKSSSLHMWEKGKEFLKKVTYILLIGSIGIWAITYLPWGTEGTDASIAGMIGKALSPIFAPLGFTITPIGWIGIVALIFGFLAKELVVGAAGVLLTGAGFAEGALGAIFVHPVIAYSYMAFTLLYIPCLASFGVIKKELGSWKWTIFAMLYGLIVAYGISFLISGIATLTGAWF